MSETNPQLSAEQKLQKSFENLAHTYDAEVLVYNGKIDENFENQIMESTAIKKDHRVLLALCTQGGNPHIAYKVAKRLQKNYSGFIMAIFGWCKSAGTLIAIGSDLLIMGPRAELGPLDIQTTDKEEINRSSSGLDVFESLNQLRMQHYGYYKTVLKEMSESNLSRKVAMAIAKDVVSGFHESIIQQIEPLALGKTGRSVNIALDYGMKLISDKRGNISSDNLNHLILNYPDHAFVIDIDESQKILRRVSAAGETEMFLADCGLITPQKTPSQLLKFEHKKVANDAGTNPGNVSEGTPQGSGGAPEGSAADIQKSERKTRLRIQQ